MPSSKAVLSSSSASKAPSSSSSNSDKNTTRKTEQPQNNNIKKKKKQVANRARHRLLSIHRDSQRLAAPSFREFLESQISPATRNWPILPNERCGSWYVCPPPTSPTVTTSRSSSCYFKSTDGHKDTWNFSFKRLNLHLLDILMSSCDTDTAGAGAGGPGIVIVDSSIRKVLPDSLARTIPIWACVLNRIAVRYRKEQLQGLWGNASAAEDDEDDDDFFARWDTSLYTPDFLVSAQEHETISDVLLDEHVEALYQSQAIVNVPHFLQCLTKPLRPIWIITHDTIGNSTSESSSSPPPSSSTSSDEWVLLTPSTITTHTTFPKDKIKEDKDRYFWIACVNPSTYNLNKATGKNQIVWQEQSKQQQQPNHHPAANHQEETATITTTTKSGFYYMSGAADDEESWARKLTPELFWQNEKQLTTTTTTTTTDPDLLSVDDDDDDDDIIDKRIDAIVAASQLILSTKMQEELVPAVPQAQDQEQHPQEEGTMDRIGKLSLWIGSRRAGRPPHCWEHFDAILNVTDHEYDGMNTVVVEGRVEDESTRQQSNDDLRYYLQLPVAEGKRDRTELERWMPVGLAFLIFHVQGRGRRVLVHCNQGKDRSVAMVLAFMCVACPLTFPVDLDPKFESWKLQELLGSSNDNDDDEEESYLRSGLSKALVDRLLLQDNNDGTSTFLQWIHSQKQVPLSEPLANKERLRISLQLIRQDRTEAEPSRSTMQKLNRFFMSSPMYREQQHE